jgi:hypothetical protein
MTEQAPDSSDISGPRRRPTPTIDLTATEVRAQEAADPAPAAESESKPEAAAEASSAPATTEAPAPAEGAAPADPAPEQASPASAASPEPPAHPAGAPMGFLAARGPRAVSGAAGAALVILILAGLWIAGVFAPRQDGGAAVSARLATLEAQLRDLSGRAGANGADAKALQDLSNRLAKLEASARQGGAGADAGLSDRIAAIEAVAKDLTAAVAELRRHTDEIAAKAADAASRAEAAARAAETARTAAAQGSGPNRKELEALVARVAALEGTSRTRQDEVATNLRGARYAVTTVALRTAVDAGVPFPSELAAVKALAASGVDFTALETLAASGIPRPQVFMRELADLGPAMLRIAQPGDGGDGGFLDRLQANAQRLVRIRRIEDGPGDDPTSIIAHLELRAIHMDVPQVLAELAKLPPAVRAPAEPWIKKAQMRVAAIALSHRLEAEALTALAGQEP